MDEKYRWNDLIKVKTKDGEYIEERPVQPTKPLIFSEVRKVHRKSLTRPFYTRREGNNGNNGKKF